MLQLVRMGHRARSQVSRSSGKKQLSHDVITGFHTKLGRGKAATVRITLIKQIYTDKDSYEVKQEARP